MITMLFLPFVWLLVICCFFMRLHHALPECSQIDECSCKLSDGKEIDIRSLGVQGKPRFPFYKDPTDPDYESTYNPCYDFTEGDCKNVIACRRTKDSTSSVGLGMATTARWGSETGSSYTILYEDSATSRSTLVELECKESATTPSLQVIGEKPGEAGKTYFVLTTQCACAGKCQLAPSPVPTKSRLSPGSIICICFAGLLVIYFIGGVIFMKFVRGARGRELIPNVTLWSSLPGYVKDGFLFIFHCAQRSKYDNI